MFEKGRDRRQQHGIGAAGAIPLGIGCEQADVVGRAIGDLEFLDHPVFAARRVALDQRVAAVVAIVEHIGQPRRRIDRVEHRRRLGLAVRNRAVAVAVALRRHERRQERHIDDALLVTLGLEPAHAAHQFQSVDDFPIQLAKGGQLLGLVLGQAVDQLGAAVVGQSAVERMVQGAADVLRPVLREHADDIVDRLVPGAGKARFDAVHGGRRLGVQVDAPVRREHAVLDRQAGPVSGRAEGETAGAAAGEHAIAEPAQQIVRRRRVLQAVDLAILERIGGGQLGKIVEFMHQRQAAQIQSFVIGFERQGVRTQVAGGRNKEAVVADKHARADFALDEGRADALVRIERVVRVARRRMDVLVEKLAEQLGRRTNLQLCRHAGARAPVLVHVLQQLAVGIFQHDAVDEAARHAVIADDTDAQHIVDDGDVDQPLDRIAGIAVARGGNIGQSLDRQHVELGAIGHHADDA